jgi:uridine phosphorylase
VPIHLKPACDLAQRVLLPGDPHRALAVAQDLLDKPLMFNHHRGLWGYTGTAADGLPLSVQSTGMGGPSAAIVCEELIELGAQTLLRIGTCGALDPELGLGDLIAVTEAMPLDGASRALGADGAVPADPGLVERLTAGGARPGRVATVDLFYADAPSVDALAVEMEAATVLHLARVHEISGACLLGVSDRADRTRIAQEDLEALGLRLGRVGYEALTGR